MGFAQRHRDAGASGSFFYTTTDEKYMVRPRPARLCACAGLSVAHGCRQVKTLTDDESALLRRILSDYIDHMKEYKESKICRCACAAAQAALPHAENGRACPVARFFGMYSIRMYGTDVNFVVMNNWVRIPPHVHVTINESEGCERAQRASSRHHGDGGGGDRVRPQGLVD